MARRAKVILINSVSSYARMGIGFVLGLWITRLTLRNLAADVATAKQIFGVYALLTSILGASLFLNQSLQTALVRFLAISLHRQDHVRTQRLFSSGWALGSGIGAAVALAMVTLVPWLLGWFNVPQGLYGQAVEVVWIIAAGHVLTSVLQPWQAAMLAQDRFTLGNVLGLAQTLLTLGGVALIPWLPTPPLVSLALVWVIPPLAMLAGTAAGMAWAWPALRLAPAAVRRVEGRELWSLSVWSSVQSLGSSLYERTDQILINLLLGPLYNTFYALALQLQAYVTSVVNVLSGVIFPTAARVVDRGTLAERRELLIRSTRYGLTLALPLAAAIAVFRRPLVQVWVGAGYEETIHVLVVVMLLVVCRAPFFVTWTFLTALNRVKWPSVALFVDALVNVPLSVFFVVVCKLGLVGIVLGTISTSVLRFAFFQVPYLARQVGISPWQYWAQSFGRPLVGGLALGLALWLVQWLGLGVWLTVGLVGLAGLGYAAWVWLLVFDRYERGLAGDVWRRLARRDLSSVAS